MADSSLRHAKPTSERSPQAINPCEAATRSAANTNLLVRRLSSLLTIWWYKRVGLWCLAIAAVLTSAFLVLLVWRGEVAAAWLLAPLLLVVLALVYLQRFVFVLADEVFDDGDALVVRYNDQTSRIPLRDIEAVDYSLVFDPPRIAIRSKTGARFVFMPFFHPRMCFFRQHPLVAELKHRIANRTT
jgi:hypothetical protein